MRRRLLLGPQSPLPDCHVCAGEPVPDTRRVALLQQVLGGIEVLGNEEPEDQSPDDAEI